MEAENSITINRLIPYFENFYNLISSRYWKAEMITRRRLLLVDRTIRGEGVLLPLRGGDQCSSLWLFVSNESVLEGAVVPQTSTQLS